MSAVGRLQPGNGKTSRLRRGNGRGSQLRDDATVTFAAERELAGIDDIIEQLNRQLVGLAPVKRRFIDEAYYLYRVTDSKDYGQEAIDILLQVMENDRDKLVVILAGYKDKMEVFFESNPGMRSRVAHHLDFASYEIGELTAIGKLLLERSSYYLSPAAEKVLREEVSRRMTEPHFANARTVRNELELARLRHAHRISSDLQREWNRDDLMRLEPADLLVDD